MRISHFFIDRPIFASVVSIIIVIVGAVAYFRLPVAQYPEIAPPIITVTGQYPGASADVVAATAVAPIEEQINGVENMIYMASNSTADGRFTISVSFDLGTNLDIAQVQVQNRVAIAQPRLPPDVRAIGVTVNKSSPDLMMVVHLISPDKSRDTLFISNYATLEIKDALTRVDGVGSITVFGSRDYSMRIWLDPDRLQSLGLTANDVTLALQGQNVQVASGVLNQPPVDQPGAFQIAVKTLGRLANPEEFANIVVKQTPTAVVRLKEVAKIELAALDYSSNSYLNVEPAVALAIFQRPGSNALDTAHKIRDMMAQLSKRFPPGLEYKIIYDPTQFIQQSVDEVQKTIFEAIILVVLVVILFLQTWRAAIIPLIAIPVSLIGTFFLMSLFGFTLNNLSLFGLVLAVGIVVDDAIVVVENVERNIEAGLSPHDASVKSMDEVGAALVAIALVLCAVFVPTVFITGISGQFYRQFALTIAGATIISLVVSLTLSPGVVCAAAQEPRGADPALVGTPAAWVLLSVQYRFRQAHGRLRLAVGARRALCADHARGLRRHPRLRPQRIPQDAGGIHPAARPRLSDRRGAAAVRRLAVAHRRGQPARRRTGDASPWRGGRRERGRLFRRDIHGRTQRRRDFHRARTVRAARRRSEQIGQCRLSASFTPSCRVIQEALILIVPPPPVQGIGNAGGFRMMVEDRAGRGSAALLEAVNAVLARARQSPEMTNVFSLFEVSTPQLYLDIDRTKAQMLGVNVTDVFAALQIYIGSLYVNDFNLFGRTFRVTAQADSKFRDSPKDVLNLRVRNSTGGTVPLASFTTVSDIAGPYRVPRYNLYPAAEIDGVAAPGYSQTQAIAALEKIANEVLPDGFSYEWTTLAFQQLRAGSTAMFAFGLAVVFVFLVLAAQFESLTLPLAIVLIVPMCLVASITGVVLRGQDNNILTQVGFVVLIGLAAKNAILIIEFAKQLEDQGRDRFAAAVEAARLRLRPILMTSFAFIFGVVPLVWAQGAGAELRQALGTAVFSGMIGVTLFGLIFTPAFYVVCRWIADKMSRRKRTLAPEASTHPAE